MKKTAHILLFVLAGIVFYLGLGAGLQYSATVGTVLWTVAGAILALNLLWIFLARK